MIFQTLTLSPPPDCMLSAYPPYHSTTTSCHLKLPTLSHCVHPNSTLIFYKIKKVCSPIACLYPLQIWWHHRQSIFLHNWPVSILIPLNMFILPLHHDHSSVTSTKSRNFAVYGMFLPITNFVTPQVVYLNWPLSLLIKLNMLILLYSIIILLSLLHNQKIAV